MRLPFSPPHLPRWVRVDQLVGGRTAGWQSRYLMDRLSTHCEASGQHNLISSWMLKLVKWVNQSCLLGAGCSSNTQWRTPQVGSSDGSMAILASAAPPADTFWNERNGRSGHAPAGDPRTGRHYTKSKIFCAASLLGITILEDRERASLNKWPQKLKGGMMWYFGQWSNQLLWSCTSFCATLSLPEMSSNWE